MTYIGIGLDTTCMYQRVPISNSKQFLRFTLLTNWRLSKVNCLHLKRGEVQPKIFFSLFAFFAEIFFDIGVKIFAEIEKRDTGPMTSRGSVTRLGHFYSNQLVTLSQGYMDYLVRKYKAKQWNNQ